MVTKKTSKMKDFSKTWVLRGKQSEEFRQKEKTDNCSKPSKKPSGTHGH